MGTMNRTPIEYVDYTWNPVVGCLNDCPYCYARTFAERGMGEYGEYEKGSRFQPRFFPERLDQPAKVKKPSRVFVVSMGDLFGDWVSLKWIMDVKAATWEASQHTYLWLTKNPQRLEWSWFSNDWVGVSVTRQEGLRPALKGLEKGEGAGVRFISFEPLLGKIIIPDDAAEILDWIIIGRQTGPGASYAIHYQVNLFEWIAEIKQFADEHSIPVFIKDNCGWWSRYQEFPEVANG